VNYFKEKYTNLVVFVLDAILIIDNKLITTALNI